MHGSGNLTSALIRAPLLRTALPFLAGLVLGRWIPLSLGIGWALLLMCFACWAFLAFRAQAYRTRWLSGMVLFVLLVVFGTLWQGLNTDRNRSDHVEKLAAKATGWEVEVTELASVKERSVRAWTSVRAAIIDGVARPASGGILVTVLTDSTRGALQPGTRLMLASRAEPIGKVPDPGGFDLRQWAAGRGVQHECFAPLERWTLSGKPSSGKGIFELARERIAGWLLVSGLPDRERALVKAILLGMRDELDRDQNQAFVRSGTIHVLAVSGTHVGIIYVAVLWALIFLGKGKQGRLVRGVVALLALWAYAGLTGFSPSVQRATVMFSLFTVAEMTGWRSESLNSLACAAAVLLLWDPNMLGQLGFQLSFLAVLGIAVFYRPIYLLWAPPNAVARFFWSLIVVSLSAQAFTIPLCLYVFQAFPIWFLPANMAIVGLVGMGVYGGIILLAVHAVPVLGPIITVLMKWLLLLLGFLSGFFSGLPGAYPAVRVGFWGMVGLYLLLACFAMWVMQRHKWARSATLGTLAVLLFGWGWTAHQRNSRSSFAVYTNREGVSAGFVQGRTLHVFSSGGSPWTARSIEAHARQAGAYRVVLADRIPRWVEAGGRRYAFLPVERTAQAAHWPSAPSTIILHGQGWLETGTLLEPDGAEWVLNADMSGGQRAMVRRWAAAKDAPLFDMLRAGAYVRP